MCGYLTSKIVVHKHKRNEEQKFNIEICITSGIHTCINFEWTSCTQVSSNRSQNAHASKKKNGRSLPSSIEKPFTVIFIIFVTTRKCNRLGPIIWLSCNTSHMREAEISKISFEPRFSKKSQIRGKVIFKTYKISIFLGMVSSTDVGMQVSY